MAPPHILVVGGTGMLMDMVEALADDGGRLSLLSRRGASVAVFAGFDCDYNDARSFSRALDSAVELSGPIDLAVAWFHSLTIPAPRMLAERVVGRHFQVLGSATADPAHPHRLEAAAAVAEGLPRCINRQVVLGFKVEGGRSRWLSNQEISTGVLEAIRADKGLSTIGQVSPWSARP